MPDIVIALLYLAILGVSVVLASAAVGGIFPVTDEPRRSGLDGGVGELG